MKLGEGLTEGSERGSPKARIGYTEARREAHRGSERGSPRLVESTPKLGEGLTEGSDRVTEGS
jgi:hypothetical protein